jgi:hypothetical protein
MRVDVSLVSLRDKVSTLEELDRILGLLHGSAARAGSLPEGLESLVECYQKVGEGTLAAVVLEAPKLRPGTKGKKNSRGVTTDRDASASVRGCQNGTNFGSATLVSVSWRP